MLRKPIVAGQFYEKDKEKLTEQIEGCFRHRLGPGALPKKQRKGMIIGVVSPHAGYPYSGPCAAHAYKAIAESEFPDLYVLLGPSHFAFHKTCFSMDDWETPLGVAKTDGDFGGLLEANMIDIIPFPHKEEHSIEVQLPFLQYISKGKEMRFVPIMIADDWKDTAPLIARAIKQYESRDKKVCIITSSDFTHYGFNYGFIPFIENIKNNLYALDKGAIDEILKVNAFGFVNYCGKTGATICGRAPIAAMLTILKELAKCKAGLLKYYTSGDMTGDYDNSVGYAAIGFR